MNYAVIVAGGTGSRMHSDIPKQFLPLCGKPVIIHTLEKFDACPEIDGIVTVCLPDWTEHCREIIREAGIRKSIDVVDGGLTRADSSRNGVEAVKRLKHGPGDVIVLIHDAARPLVTGEIITANIAAASKTGACETALRMTDTVLRGENGLAKEVVPRKNLYRVQTPQTFRLEVIDEAFGKYEPGRDGEVTDDAELVLRAGGMVAIAEGSPNNIKITEKDDLATAAAILLHQKNAGQRPKKLLDKQKTRL